MSNLYELQNRIDEVKLVCVVSKETCANGSSMTWITDFSLSILWTQTGILICLRKKCNFKDK